LWRSSSAREIAHRAQTRITRSVRKARSSFLRTIEEFDFTFQNSVRLQMLETLLGPELVSEGRGALISGAPGRGKTHLTVAIAYRAIQNGFEARFTTADELVGELSLAARQGQLEEALEPYVHPHVLVIDVLGYQSYAADAASVLFRVVSIRHLKRRPILVTTNKPLAALGRVLHDADLPEANPRSAPRARHTTSCAAARTGPVTGRRNHRHSRKTPLDYAWRRQSLERNGDIFQRTHNIKVRCVGHSARRAGIGSLTHVIIDDSHQRYRCHYCVRTSACDVSCLCMTDE
jgi:DNA replication protein DnaC